MADELFYAPATSKPVTPPVEAVRAFVFTSGARWMEKRGLMDRYRALLPDDLRDMIETTTTDQWISLADALRIYA
ncbi:MAG: hypothetical protein ABIP39_11935 [Polyangiaceae bacterium]